MILDDYINFEQKTYIECYHHQFGYISEQKNVTV